MIILVCSLKSTYTKFHGSCVSELHAHPCPYHNVWPEVFIVVLQELHCLSNNLHVSMIRVIGFYHFTKFRCSKTSTFRDSIAWGCFLLNYTVYYNVYCDYFGVFIKKHIYTNFHLDRKLCQ